MEQFKKKIYTISFRIADEERERIKVAAAEQGLTVSGWIRNLINQELAKEKEA